MPQVTYTVEQVDGVWTVGLNDKRFGPYSGLEAAVAAASKAAHKAEAQGYEAFVVIETPAEPAAAAEQHAA
ncbi:MAG: hypothetical protein JF588_15320 [Caulobacterales bacterium]|nr:hypothetical protein [Caulobacterales bacterium]